MKRLFNMHACAIVLLSAVLTGAGAAESTSVPGAASAVSSELAATMTALADRADAVWNQRDAAGMTALYAPDATTTIGGAIRLKGHAEIQGHFTKSFASLPPGMIHRTVVKRIEPLGNMVAIDSAVTIEMPDGAQGTRVLREFFTFALVRPKPGGWEFVAVRATPLGAAPRANG